MPSSVLDFLVEFDESRTFGLNGSYFRFHGALEKLFQKKVDLVTDFFAEPASAFPGHARGHRAGRDAAGLQDDDLFFLCRGE